MAPKRYFQFCGLLPFLGPLAAYGLLFCLGYLRVSSPDSVVRLLMTVVMSFYVGGIPYLIFATVVLWVLRKRSFREYQRMALISPILFLLFFGFCVVGFAIIVGQVGPMSAFNTELFGIYGIIIVLGYSYVLIALIGYRVLRRFGWIEVNHPPNISLQTDRQAPAERQR